MAFSALASSSPAESRPVRASTMAIARRDPHSQTTRFFFMVKRILSFARRQFPVPATQWLLAGDDFSPSGSAIGKPPSSSGNNRCKVENHFCFLRVRDPKSCTVISGRGHGCQEEVPTSLILGSRPRRQDQASFTQFLYWFRNNSFEFLPCLADKTIVTDFVHLGHSLSST